MSNEKLKDLDECIESLKVMLNDKELKFEQKMKVHARLERLFNLRLRYAGTRRGAQFNDNGGQ